MKMVLCSEGFLTPNTVQACVELCNKPKDEISFAVINEAYAVTETDKRGVIENLSCLAKNFAGEIDMVNLLALSIEEVERRISSKDVIFVIGGDADYLMTVFQKTGFDELLPKLLETKVYVGSSAGSMIVGNRVSDEVYKLIYNKDSIYDVSDYLGLVDLSIVSHLDSDEFPIRRTGLPDAVGNFNKKVYGIRDDSAVVVDGPEINVIGSEPLVCN